MCFSLCATEEFVQIMYFRHKRKLSQEDSGIAESMKDGKN